MTDGRGPVAVAVVALLGACVAAFVIGTPARSLRGDAAAQSFLDTWRASRMTTFVVENDFTRTMPDGAQLRQTTKLVQRPPSDRLLIGFGAVAGRLAGKVVRCASSPDGSSQCLTSEAAPDYGAEVDQEVASLARYVRSGGLPLYRVVAFSDTPGPCFRLDLTLDVPAPPYGDHALFCFDRATLAPSLTLIERPEAIDRSEARAIRSEVRAGDLELKADPAALPAGAG